MTAGLNKSVSVLPFSECLHACRGELRQGECENSPKERRRAEESKREREKDRERGREGWRQGEGENREIQIAQ